MVENNTNNIVWRWISFVFSENKKKLTWETRKRAHTLVRNQIEKSSFFRCVHVHLCVCICAKLIAWNLQSWLFHNWLNWLYISLRLCWHSWYSNLPFPIFKHMTAADSRCHELLFISAFFYYDLLDMWMLFSLSSSSSSFSFLFLSIYFFSALSAQWLYFSVKTFVSIQLCTVILGYVVRDKQLIWWTTIYVERNIFHVSFPLWRKFVFFSFFLYAFNDPSFL